MNNAAENGTSLHKSLTWEEHQAELARLEGIVRDEQTRINTTPTPVPASPFTPRTQPMTRLHQAILGVLTLAFAALVAVLAWGALTTDQATPCVTQVEAINNQTGTADAAGQCIG